MTREELKENCLKQSATEIIYASGWGIHESATDLLECAYRMGWEGADANPNYWHCVADGDLPKEDILTNNTLIVYGDNIGFEYSVNYMNGAFGNDYWDYDNGDDFDIIDGVEYWMEIKLPNNK